MFRKATLGLIVAASLGAAALAPTSASAHIHGHWGHGWGFGGISLNTGADCLQQQVVETRHGPRVRAVNVCA